MSDTGAETEIKIADAPPEVDGRQIADDAMRNETWEWTRKDGGNGTDPTWKYWGEKSQEWINVENPDLADLEANR